MTTGRTAICTSVDYHTAGEPFRIIADPPVEVPVATVALGVWAVEAGLVAVRPSATTEIRIDVPSGRVRAQVHTDSAGRVASVDFVNVPSRLIATGIAVDTGRGRLTVDLAWGGAFYALVDGDRLGVDVVPDHLGDLIVLGREVKAALAGHPQTAHPVDERLSGVYGTIIVNRLGTTDTGELHQRNVTVFADGQVDRSPCGSGTASRIAALHASGELGPGQTLIHDSIIGTRFRARVLEETEGGVVPVVAGSAHRVASTHFERDPRDPLVPGFVLR